VIDDKTTDAELTRWARPASRHSPESCDGRHQRSIGRAPAIRHAVARAEKRGWHIQFNTAAGHRRAQPAVFASPVPLVIDHFGGATAARGLDQPGFGAL
jgi:predicted TIM-barrel fold metal-dependent hydrolase